MKDFNMNIIILGPQGSGKGTQAELLAKKFDLEHLDMGTLLREVAKEDSELGREVYNIQNITNTLVPGRIVKEVLTSKLVSIPKEKSIVFDGVPRTLEQVEYLNNALEQSEKKIDKVFFINISGAETIDRLSRRRVCEDCKAVLIMGKDVQSESDKCPGCGGKISQRLDDTPEGIKKRLSVYNEETLPVLDYFKSKGILTEINGEQAVEKVSEEIIKNIES